MSEHFNGLTPAQAEIIAMIAEEAGEIVQAVGKILRHGLYSTHPDGGPENVEALWRELGDLFGVVDFACDTMGNDFNRDEIEAARRDKSHRIELGECYTHHQRHEGGEG